jgi:chromosome segregation ATPase
MASLSLTLVEIIVLMLGAITLGITIHFFIVSRRSLSTTVSDASAKTSKELEDWKLRYFNDIELRDKELALLKQKLSETEENNDINTIEADEMRILNRKLKAELESLRNATPLNVTTTDKAGDYVEQLKLAQSGLLEHNEKINQLLRQIDIVKETEAKQQEIQRVNEELSNQIDDLKYILAQKEKEINNTRQKEHLTSEMTSMLDSAYNEFNTLQDKIHKLEGQVNSSRRVSLDYEDLQEGYHKLLRDFDEQKLKYNAAVAEGQQLKTSYEEVEDKLKEANFQRQQLQKRVAYLEELNNDMQAVADANKKLESQLKRVGELESMLNVIAEERDELVRKQTRTH